ncbi:hypothetical protein LC76P1_00225 [Lysinibacillus phage LC76P1]|nr:hypothetical protein LC76P1_00225 [Lysinibacillus phage LC76P1]
MRFKEMEKLSSEFLLNEATLDDTATCVRFVVYDTYSRKKLKTSTLKHLFKEPEDAVHFLEHSGYKAVEDDPRGIKYKMVVGSTTRIAKIDSMNIFSFDS